MSTGVLGLWLTKGASVKRQEGEGKGRMKKKKKKNQLFGLLGIRASPSSRQSHAQKVTLHPKGAQRVFAGAGLAV